MSALGRTAFKGASGTPYAFKVYPLGTRIRKLSGVYVITSRFKRTNGGYRHVPLYVGQTQDLSQPLNKHRKADAFHERGANCICLQSDPSEQSRLSKQQDLIAAFHPVCND